MKKGELLKVSQFNYFTTDKDGNLMICNMAKGYKSLSKVLREDIEKFNEIMNNKNLVYDDTVQAIVDLCNEGFLVPQSCDEILIADSMYYDAAMVDKLTLIVMPTEKCNFRCKYCYESYEKGKMSKADQISLLKYIQRKIAVHKNLRISWFGGEPLEAYDVIENLMENIKNMCEKNKVMYTSDMTTNAYSLNPETFDRLYNFKVYNYQITLDGLKEQHDKQRILEDGGGTFDRIVENLIYIKNNHAKYKLAYITIRVNVTREILNNFEEFIKFYKDNFGNDNRFGLAFTPARDMGGDVVKSIQDKFIECDELYDKINELGLYEDPALTFPDVTRVFTPTAALCYGSQKNSFVIGSDLKMYKCTVRFDMDENAIGKIHSNGDAVINDHLHTQWYMKRIPKEMCKTCFLLACCHGGGCPYRRNFACDAGKSCVLAVWKKEIKHSMKYLDYRYKSKMINFSEVVNEN